MVEIRGTTISETLSIWRLVTRLLGLGLVGGSFPAAGANAADNICEQHL